MELSQIIGIGGLVLLAAFGFWAMRGRNKVKSEDKHRGDGPGEGTHGTSSEAFRRAGEDQPGGD